MLRGVFILHIKVFMKPLGIPVWLFISYAPISNAMKFMLRGDIKSSTAATEIKNPEKQLPSGGKFVLHKTPEFREK